ncbi:dihydropteroate synthase [Candidatus Laterigemmans baculatus]|uniref:dihydropteroate synthase n=1 Tax=Candidatus Laterigemmans baculatus TaxID=2770505 RepID=UPI001F38BE79|nr:dihydropteroate synthase [Candidatus Laterigemmans baculatus]
MDHWKLRTRQLRFGPIPLVMGILNVTPDSFSDGGRFAGPTAAVDAALRMEDAGAAILDIGGESTRPYSQPVSPDEQRRRVMPVIERLATRLRIPISIDTCSAAVASDAIAGGAEIINDISGLRFDPEMLPLARRSGAGVCVMHIQGTPQTMQDDPHYEDVVSEVDAYLRETLAGCLAEGLERQRICLDPGVGFGKTHAHNLALLRGVRRFLEIGQPLLIGHSRKGFIAHVLGDKTLDRTAGSVGVSLAMAAAGVPLLRVHDVAETCQALRLFEAAGGCEAAVGGG